MADRVQSLEDNIATFNADTAEHGGYVYTAVERWSARHATARQTGELVRILTQHFPRSIRLVDIGCGDGFFTMELAQKFGPAAIRGIDPAALAIEAARRRVPSNFSGRITFEVGNIYDFAGGGEDVVVLRGVLHHLDRPEAAIDHLAAHFKAIVVLEPNGYNPMMKIIEKVSPYHRQHDEKSYWPPTLNEWFQKRGFSVVAQNYSCLVPYFCPTPLAKMLSAAEPVFESIPFVRQLCCGTNLIAYRAV